MAHALPKRTVLIVDDTPENIDLLCAALGDEYHIKVALDGEKAIKMAMQHKPDLILLDVLMPGMDGFQVCNALKRTAETKNIPIIFATTLGSTDDEEKGLNLGAVDYIIKPFSQPIVRARVKTHVSLKVKSDLLESLALLDSLTGIPNRRRFNDALETEWKRAQRSGDPLAVIMADIDFFKYYNDAYGHGAGDNCLRMVAAMLTDEGIFRPGDLVARYGGEEFIALLPETDDQGASQLAERFRKGIEAMQISHEHSATSPWVTVSVGYASLIPGEEHTSDTLVDAADRQLYLAKHAGRNCVRGSIDC